MCFYVKYLFGLKALHRELNPDLCLAVLNNFYNLLFVFIASDHFEFYDQSLHPSSLANYH